MAAFAYDAINAQGLESSGDIHAPDVSAAREQLQTRGLLPQSLAERTAAGERGPASAFKKVKPKSLQVFARQFATMIGAGVSVVQALVTLEEQTDDKYLAEVIADVRSDVEGGVILSRALARHPKVFNRLFVAMVEAGESSGTLDTVLDRVAMQIEKETQIKRRDQERAGLSHRRHLVRIPRSHVHAPVHHPRLRERLRLAGRRAAEAHAVRHARLVRDAALLVHHLPGDRADDLRASAA